MPNTQNHTPLSIRIPHYGIIWIKSLAVILFLLSIVLFTFGVIFYNTSYTSMANMAELERQLNFPAETRQINYRWIYTGALVYLLGGAFSAYLAYLAFCYARTLQLLEKEFSTIEVEKGIFYCVRVCKALIVMVIIYGILFLTL